MPAGLERLADAAWAGSAAGAASGSTPVFNSATGRAAAGTPKLDLARSTYNFSPSSLDKWRKALARAAAGGAAAHALLAGDSITYGNPGGLTSSSQRYGEVFRQQLLNHGGVDHGTGLQNVESLAVNSGPLTAVNVGNINIGLVNGMQWFNSTGSITLTAVCDAFVVKYAKMTNGGAGAAVTLDGVAQTSIDCNAAPAGGSINTITYTPASQGSHTLVITGPSSNNCYIFAIEARKNTANGGVRVSTIAHGGISTIQMAESTGSGFNSMSNVSSLASITHMAADLLVVNVGVNDYTAAASVGGVQLPLASYKANLQTVITAQKAAGGDVLLCGFTPIGGTPTIPEASYIQQLYDLADANDVALLDFQRRFVSRTVSSGMFADAYHPNSQGHADMGNALYGALASLGGI